MPHLYDSPPGPPSGYGGGLGDLYSPNIGSPGRMSSRLAVNATQNKGVRYPSPFFDLATTYMPKSIKQLFQWCAYYFKVHPLINAVVYKMSEYPITKIIVETDDPNLKRKWEEVIENILQVRKFQIASNLDYNTFGNSFCSVSFPFIKYIKCKHCGFMKPIREMRAHYRWRSLKYYFECPRCSEHAPALIEDRYIKDIHGIRLVRWAPQLIDIDYNQATGKSSYYYRLPPTLKNDILIGKRKILEEVPAVFVDAARKGKSVLFNEDEDSVFHLKRPTIAEHDMGWGMPMILPVLKDVFYLQVLRKGQEAIAQEHIVPLRILFPQAGDGISSPYSTTNLGSWKSRIEAEIGRWRLDPNYIPVLPLPVGHQLIGGQGRAMVLHQELRVWAEHIVAGMGVPQEFIFGGLNYSGSNVSMRMLENQFLGLRNDHLIMVKDFILKQVARYMGWPSVNVRFERFKMADDLQRLMVYFQANQAGKVSDTTLLRELGEDLDREEERKQRELAKQIEAQKKMQRAQAEIAGQQQMIQQRYMQKAMQGGLPGMHQGAPAPEAAGGVPGAYGENAGQAPQEGLPTEMMSPVQLNETGQGGVNVLYLAKRMAAHVGGLPPQEQQQMLGQIKLQNPHLHDLVIQIMQGKQGSNENPLDPAQSPLAQEKPPRSPTPSV